MLVGFYLLPSICQYPCAYMYIHAYIHMNIHIWSVPYIYIHIYIHVYFGGARCYQPCCVSRNSYTFNFGTQFWPTPWRFFWSDGWNLYWSGWNPIDFCGLWPTVTGSQARKQKTMMEGVRHFSDVHLTTIWQPCASIYPCTDGHRNPECFLGLQTSWPWAMAIEIQLTGEITLANTMVTKIYWLLEFPMANFILPCPKMGWFQFDWWATEDDPLAKGTVGMGKFSRWKVVTLRKLRNFLQASSQFDVHSSFIQQFIHPTNLTEH